MVGPTLQLPGKRLRVVHPLAIEVIEGPQAGLRFGPFQPPIRIGSAPGNEVVLEDPAVSRHHATLERSKLGLQLSDAGSTNGLRLGGHRVLSALLEDRARMTLGQTVLELRVEDGQPELCTEVSGEVLGMVASSSIMQDFLRDLTRVAPAPVPVLIQGETGTGKELTARALHRTGPGPGTPFVVVDCGAAAAGLVESTLFGHERGAFTGAEDRRKGAFAAANGGTLFLDEIGELPLDLQPKLLRALESSTVTPLGADRPVSFSVRVVAATHRDLRRMVNDGTFREDLYFRLAVCPLQLPPLRERAEDIPTMAQTFFREALELSGELPPSEPGLSPETLHWLCRQTWPGNVRELRNTIQRSVLLGSAEDLAAGRLHVNAHGTPSSDTSIVAPTLEEAKRTFERGYLLDLLRRHDRDREAAAREADIHPKSLQRLVRRHDLKDELP